MSSTSPWRSQCMPYYRNKRVLVTGANGFIGSRLVARLVSLGADVSAVTSREGNSHRLDDLKAKINLLTGDLSDKIKVHKIFQDSNPDVVFHTASSLNTEKSLEHADQILGNTYGLARNVLEVSVESGVESFVQFGSIEEYGSCETPFTETMREEPFSPYSLGKVMSTHLAMVISQLTQMRVCVVRPAATYGPGQGPGMLIPNLIRAGLEKQDFDMNPGEQLRDFVYVEDLIEGALACGMRESTAGQIINLGSNRGRRVREIAEAVNAAMGNPIRIHFGAREYRPLDSMEFYMSSEKAKQLLGWEATTSLAESVAQTVDWYTRHAAGAAS